MDVILYTDRRANMEGGARCRRCGRSVQPGQHVLRDLLKDPHRTLYTHVNPCLRRMVDDTPDIDGAMATTADVALDQLRRDHEAALAQGAAR